MTLTTEQRQLLEGDVERAQRNLPLLGWGSALTAPDWVQKRILEIRSAIQEKRSIPAPSALYVREAEQRSATLRNAMRFAKRLFMQDNSREAIARRNGLTMDQLLDAELRDQVRRQATELRIGTGAGPGDAGFGRGEDGGQSADPQYLFRCTANSTGTSREEHRAAAYAHRNVRDKQKTADDYQWQDDAADDHDLAADGSEDERAAASVRCSVRCKRPRK